MTDPDEPGVYRVRVRVRVPDPDPPVQFAVWDGMTWRVLSVTRPHPASADIEWGQRVGDLPAAALTPTAACPLP